MAKNCDNCINSGRPSYEYPCIVCETAYGSAPSKWKSIVSETVDMVEVVRCKDCKNWMHEYDDVGLCVTDVPDIDGVQRLVFDFCSYGERKDND